MKKIRSIARFLSVLPLSGILFGTALCLPARAATEAQALPLAVHSGGVTGVAGVTAVFLAGPAASRQDQAAEQRAGEQAAAEQRAGEQGAVEQDEFAAYRLSPSVRLLGKWLHLKPEESSRIFEILNFLIVALTIGYFMGKYLPKLIRERRESIQKQLVDARKATDDANSRLSSIERRLARLDDEIGEIRSRAERETVEDEARIKASIEKERLRIVASAEQEIESAGVAAQRELKRFAGELAIERAAGKLRLTEQDDRMLIRELAQGLSGGLGGGLGDPPRNGGQN